MLLFEARVNHRDTRELVVEEEEEEEAEMTRDTAKDNFCAAAEEEVI